MNVGIWGGMWGGIGVMGHNRDVGMGGLGCWEWEPLVVEPKGARMWGWDLGGFGVGNRWGGDPMGVEAAEREGWDVGMGLG